MSFPAMVAEQLILAVLLNGTGMSEKKNQIGLGLAALSLFLALTGLGFLMAAGYAFLQEQFDTKTAAFYMALVTLACATVSSLTAYALFHYRQKRIRSYQRTITDNIHSAINAVSDELEGPIRDNPKTAALLAGLAGYAAAQRFH
jgi:hypothetical protein